MKLLHTSDWHLGHVLYNYDRTEEQAAMLQQMADIVREERPDAFLLCGDVYHTAQPSAAVQKLFAEAMFRIHEANPEMRIIVTAGNHDSASKHDIFHTPWLRHNVITIGSVDKDDPESLIIEIPGKGFVIAVPYCNERTMPEGLFQQLLDAVEQRNTGGLPVVMTAHTTVSGCSYDGHENATDREVGGIESLDITDMGSGYDYLALGHIHCKQFVHTGRHNVRYCGTPLPVSFDEEFEHTISIVEIDRHGCQPHVREIAIKNPHPLVTLPKTGLVFTNWEEAKKAIRKFPDDNAAYVRLNVEVDGYLPAEAKSEAAEATADKQCRFCLINALRKVSASASGTQVLSVHEFKAIEPKEIAKRFFESEGIPFNEEMEEVFDEARRLVNEEERI